MALGVVGGWAIDGVEDFRGIGRGRGWGGGRCGWCFLEYDAILADGNHKCRWES